MKHAKRVMLVLLAGMMFILLASCNPVDEGDTGSDTSNASGRKPDFSKDEGPVKIGFNLEETGNVASYGTSCHKGAELAINEINAAGGVLGRQIEAVWDDNASKSEQANTVAKKLINENGVHVVIGAVASTNSIATAKVATDAKVPMVTPASTNPMVTVDEKGEVRRYVFRTCFTDDFQAERMADFAVNGIGATKAVILYDAESDYSVGIRDVIKGIGKDLGLEVVAEDSFLATGETDYRSKLSKFKELDFDVLIVPGYYNQVALIANQARQVGLTQPLLGGDGFDSTDLWENAGKNIEGSYFTNHYASSDPDPSVQDFITSYKEAYGGETPDSMGILGYDAVLVVVDAIKRAGGTDPEAITDALAATKDLKLASGSITMDELHNAVKKIVVLEIGQGGELELAHTYQPDDAIGTAFATTEVAAVEEVEDEESTEEEPAGE